MNQIKRIISHSSSSDDKNNIFDNDPDTFMIGDRVWVQGVKPGYIVYIGDVKFAKGIWAGIVLDRPEGKNDGSVYGVRYFQCQPQQGLFTRLHRLSRYPIDVIDVNNNPIIDLNEKSNIEYIDNVDEQQQHNQPIMTTTTTTETIKNTRPMSSSSTSCSASQNPRQQQSSTTTTVRTQRLCSPDGKVTTTITRITKSPLNVPHYMLPIKPTKVITTVTTTTINNKINKSNMNTTKQPKSALKQRSKTFDNSVHNPSTTAAHHHNKSMNKHHVHF